MKTRLFLAGATGVIGRRLVPMLMAAGFEVHGSTRSVDKAAALRQQGARAWIVDVFDAQALRDVLLQVRPAIVVHQLTDLPPGLDPARMADAVARNARVRREGTSNLVAAAAAAGCEAIVAQSIAWAYAPSGERPYTETQPLDLSAEGSRAITVAGVAALEAAVLAAPGMRGAVLRYGHLYGPGTGFDAPTGAAPLHVDAAAYAAWLAVQKAGRGVFNLCEPNASVSARKAQDELGWSPDFRLQPGDPEALS